MQGDIVDRMRFKETRFETFIESAAFLTVTVIDLPRGRAESDLNSSVLSII